jgi:hypothetical protein
MPQHFIVILARSTWAWFVPACFPLAERLRVGRSSGRVAPIGGNLLDNARQVVDKRRPRIEDAKPLPKKALSFSQS